MSNLDLTQSIVAVACCFVVKQLEPICTFVSALILENTCITRWVINSVVYSAILSVLYTFIYAIIQKKTWSLIFTLLYYRLDCIYSQSFFCLKNVLS